MSRPTPVFTERPTAVLDLLVRLALAWGAFVLAVVGATVVLGRTDLGAVSVGFSALCTLAFTTALLVVVAPGRSRLGVTAVVLLAWGLVAWLGIVGLMALGGVQVLLVGAAFAAAGWRRLTGGLALLVPVAVLLAPVPWLLLAVGVVVLIVAMGLELRHARAPSVLVAGLAGSLALVLQGMALVFGGVSHLTPSSGATFTGVVALAHLASVVAGGAACRHAAGRWLSAIAAIAATAVPMSLPTLTMTWNGPQPSLACLLLLALGWAWWTSPGTVVHGGAPLPPAFTWAPGPSPLARLAGAFGVFFALAGAMALEPRPAFVLEGPVPETIRDAAFRPDHRHLVALSGGREVTAWDVPSGRRLFARTLPHDSVATRFTPDGNALLLFGERGEVQHLDAGTGRLLRTSLCEPFDRVVLCPVGRRGAHLWRDVAGEQTAGCWDYGTEATPAPFSLAGVLGLAWSPDGRHLLTHEPGFVVRRDARNGRRLEARPLHGDVGDHLAISPEGRALATARSDGRVEVLELATGRVRATMVGHVQQVLTASFTANSKRLVTTGHGRLDPTVRVWDADSGRLLATFPGRWPATALRSNPLPPWKPFDAPCVSLDGRWVVTLTAGGPQVWDTRAVGGALAWLRAEVRQQ
jgi:hypothetical protein